MKITEGQFGDLIETVEYLIVNEDNISQEVLSKALRLMHKTLKQIGPSMMKKKAAKKLGL